jgi:GDP-4-dehydro-6-deoxy-D-mannose reductase
LTPTWLGCNGSFSATRFLPWKPGFSFSRKNPVSKAETGLKPMRILITGITGFVGGHLAEALLARGGNEVMGVSRHGQWAPAWQHLGNRVRLSTCELCRAEAVEKLVNETQPEQVYHLAGYAHAGRSFAEADAAWAGNLGATQNLYEALDRSDLRPRILYVSSALVYGEPESAEQALDENAPFHPVSPYAQSKAEAERLSGQYCGEKNFDIVRVRPFNHIGPQQSPDFAVPNFARQIAAIEQGKQEPVLETGNLSARRDFTDVRDMVQAYILLLERGRRGEAYNAGSGTAHSMQEVLDQILALSPAAIKVRTRADLMRQKEVSSIVADAAKLRRETNWRPRFTLVQTLTDVLNSWRRIAAGDRPS